MRIDRQMTNVVPKQARRLIAQLPPVKRITDQGKRAELYRQVQKLVMEEAPWLFVADWAHADAWRSNVQGVSYILQDIGLIDLRRATVR